jgi:plastocyanin
MRRFTPLIAAVAVVSLQVACGDPGAVLQPDSRAAVASRAEAKAAETGVRRIEILDACDPATFNAAIGTGACTRSGGLSFEQFIDQLTRRQVIESWRFSPATVEVRVGQSLLAINRGGEVHTFTEVESFGGGIVPVLNQLSGNPDVAPECLALAPTDFLPPGGSASDDVDEAGTENYQCCIHPWMRTTVNARGS